MQNNINRWYDSVGGRWISEDPIGFDAEDANLNRYVLSNPLVNVDPFGLTEEEDVFDAIPETSDTITVLHDGSEVTMDVAAAYQAIRSGNPRVRIPVGNGTVLVAITSVVDALGAFTPNSPCGNWYKETMLAIHRARLTGRGCRVIKPKPFGEDGADYATSCRDNMPGFQMQCLFQRVAGKIYESCIEIANNSSS